MQRCNDISKFNIHKYNDNIIEIYINRLSTTMLIFIAMDYLLLMSEKYVHFRKRQNHVLRNVFSPRISNWIHVNIFRIMCTLFFYKYMGKLGWSSMCLRFSKFEPEIMLDGMLNFKTHFMVWYCVWYEHCNGLF